MKIGKERIKGLTQKPLASGITYVWEPNPRERKAGWRTLTLGPDLPAAIAAANKRNGEIDTWKSGGARPPAVRQFNKAQTFGHVLDCYERDVLAKKRESTRRVDGVAIRRLRLWAGQHPWRWINRARVKALRDGRLTTVGHAGAFHELTTLRKILGWWIDENDLQWQNPAARFGLEALPPRTQLWEPDAQAAFIAAAKALNLPTIALAFRIATYTGQRESDVLSLTRAKWKETSARELDLKEDSDEYRRLASDHGPDAGKVMGIRLRQAKTGQWIGTPVEGTLRDEIEAIIEQAVERARKQGITGAIHLVSRDGDGQRWKQRHFIDKFSDVRTKAIKTAQEAGDTELAERLATLQFRDLRRTCIVMLGQLNLNDYIIASITGHKQATIKRILETYMPRNIAAAARGVIARIGPEESPPAKAPPKESRNSD